MLTQRLKEALALVDVRTLDHIIVGGEAHYIIRRAGPDLTAGGFGPFFAAPGCCSRAIAGLRYCVQTVCVGRFT